MGIQFKNAYWVWVWEFYAINKENVFPNLLIGLSLYYKIQRLS